MLTVWVIKYVLVIFRLWHKPDPGSYPPQINKNFKNNTLLPVGNSAYKNEPWTVSVASCWWSQQHVYLQATIKDFLRRSWCVQLSSWLPPVWKEGRSCRNGWSWGREVLIDLGLSFSFFMRLCELLPVCQHRARPMTCSRAGGIINQKQHAWSAQNQKRFLRLFWNTLVLVAPNFKWKHRV